MSADKKQRTSTQSQTLDMERKIMSQSVFPYNTAGWC